MSAREGVTLYVLDGKRVDRWSFMRAAGKCGLLDFEGIVWETYHDSKGTMRQCFAGESVFMIISQKAPCLN